MNVTREVIIDLLPVYLAGEASMDTRNLVESFLKQDPELSQRIRGQWVENMTRAVPSSLPAALELKAFLRTRRLLGWQRWLLGFAFFFTALLLSSKFTIERRQITEFHFLFRDYPAELSICVLLALACWVAYFAIRRRLRFAAPKSDAKG